MQIEFTYDGRKYVVVTKPVSIEAYKKYVIGSASIATHLMKLEEFLEKCTDIEELDKLIARKDGLEKALTSLPAEFGQELTEAVSIDGKQVEGPFSIAEYTCIGTVLSKIALPKEEDLKNLGG